MYQVNPSFMFFTMNNHVFHHRFYWPRAGSNHRPSKPQCASCHCSILAQQQWNHWNLFEISLNLFSLCNRKLSTDCPKKPVFLNECFLRNWSWRIFHVEHSQIHIEEREKKLSDGWFKAWFYNSNNIFSSRQAYKKSARARVYRHLLDCLNYACIVAVTLIQCGVLELRFASSK